MYNSIYSTDFQYLWFIFQQPEVPPFVSLEFQGANHSAVIPPSVEYKIKGTDNPRTRVRLFLEALHSIPELCTMTLSGKR